jgi:hypothetical protein
VSNFLEVREVAVEKSASDGKEIGVTRVLDLDNTPGVLPGANLLSTDFQNFFRTNDGKWHKTTEFCILFNGVLVIFFDVVWEVVNGDAIVLNVLHNELLGLGQFSRSEGISLADDGDDIDTWRQSLHQFNVKFSKTVSSRGDKVEQSVNSVVPESGVTLNSGLFGKNVVVLAFQVSDNFGEAIEKLVFCRTLMECVVVAIPGLIVNLVAESGSVDNGQGDAGALLIKFKLCRETMS